MLTLIKTCHTVYKRGVAFCIKKLLLLLVLVLALTIMQQAVWLID